MAEIIAKVNDLFTGEPSEDDKLVDVNHVLKGKLLASEVLRQQAANNTKEQFAASPDLRRELNSEVVRRGLKDILLDHAGLYEALRAATEG